jgi:hypothetical protein
MGLDAISELDVKGYERSIRHYTGPPLPLRPAVHWTNGPPEGYDEPWRDPRCDCSHNVCLCVYRTWKILRRRPGMRWPSGGGVPRGLDRAVETVISRSADLSGSQRAAIEARDRGQPGHGGGAMKTGWLSVRSAGQPVNAAEAAVAAALAEAGAVVPEGLPTHAEEMAETGLDVLSVADAGSS